MYSYCFIFQGMEPIYLVWYIYYGLTGVIQACSMLNFWKHVAIAHFHGFFLVFFFFWVMPQSGRHHLTLSTCQNQSAGKISVLKMNCI